MHDVSSAILFYKRAHQLAGAANFLEKTRTLSRIEGIQLLSIGSAKNILLDTTFEPFVKRYPAFHRKLIEKVQ